MIYIQFWWILFLLGSITIYSCEGATDVSSGLRQFHEAFARVQGVLHEMPSYVEIHELQIPRDRRANSIDTSNDPEGNDESVDFKNAADIWYQQIIERREKMKKSMRRSAENADDQGEANGSTLGVLGQTHETEISKVKRKYKKLAPIVSKVLLPEKYAFNGSSIPSQFDLKMKNMQGILVEDDKKVKKKPLVDYAAANQEMRDAVKALGVPEEPLTEQSNNLSHEANYKLSKIEQEQAEASRKSIKTTARGALVGKRNSVNRVNKRKSSKGLGMLNKPRSSFYKRTYSSRFGKRSSSSSATFNPINEIKLKTSHRLMNKGFGPSLPSNSLAENKREMFVDDMVRRKEKQLEIDGNRLTQKKEDSNPYVPIHWMDTPESTYVNERFRFDLPGYGPYDEEDYPRNIHIMTDNPLPRETRLSFGDVRQKRLSKSIEKPLREIKAEETIDSSKLASNSKSTKLIEAANKLIEKKGAKKEDNAAFSDSKSKIEGSNLNYGGFDAHSSESSDNPLKYFTVLRVQSDGENPAKNRVKRYLLSKHGIHHSLRNLRRNKRFPRQQQQRKKRYVDVDTDVFRIGRDFDTFERNEDEKYGVRMRRSLPSSQESTVHHLHRRVKRSLEPPRIEHKISKRSVRYLDDPEDHNGNNKHIYSSLLGDGVSNLRDTSSESYDIFHSGLYPKLNMKYKLNNDPPNQNDDQPFVVKLMFSNNNRSSSGNTDNYDSKNNSLSGLMKLQNDILNCNAFQTLGQFVPKEKKSMANSCRQGQQLHEGSDVQHRDAEKLQLFEELVRQQLTKTKQPQQRIQQTQQIQKSQEQQQEQLQQQQQQQPKQQQQQNQQQPQQQQQQPQKQQQQQQKQQAQQMQQKQQIKTRPLTPEEMKERQKLQKEHQLRLELQEQQLKQQKIWQNQMQGQLQKIWNQQLQQQRHNNAQQQQQELELLKQRQLEQLHQQLCELRKQQQYQKHRQQLLRALQERHKQLVEEARKHIEQKELKEKQDLNQKQPQQQQQQAQSPQQIKPGTKGNRLQDLEKELEKVKEINKKHDSLLQQQQQQQQQQQNKQHTNPILQQKNLKLDNFEKNAAHSLTFNIENPQDKLNSHLLNTILKGVGTVKQAIGNNSMQIELESHKFQRQARNIKQQESEDEDDDEEEDDEEVDSKRELKSKYREKETSFVDKKPPEKPAEKGAKKKPVKQKPKPVTPKAKGKPPKQKDKPDEPVHEDEHPKEKKHDDEEVEGECSSKNEALSEDTYKRLINGKLSTDIVDSVFESLKKDNDMKSLYRELKENRCCLKRAQELGIYDPRKTTSVKESEEVMKKFMDTVGSIIEKQVCARTCLALPPPLNHFYEIVLSTHASREKTRRRRNVHPKDMAVNFNNKLRQIDVNKIDQKSRIVKKLLRQYDELSEDDQLAAVKLRDQLLMDLVRLRRMEDEVPRRTRTPKMAQLIKNTRERMNVFKDFENELSSRYINLLKIAEVFKETSFEDDF